MKENLMKTRILSVLAFGALLTACPSGTTGDGGEGEGEGEGEDEDLEAAEQALVAAYVAKFEACTPLLILEPGFADELFAEGFAERLPGADYTVADLRACADALASINCAQLQDGSQIAGCEGLNTGTLANDDACVDDDQCQSGICNREGDCGVCAAESNTCDSNDDCPAAQVCEFNGICVAPVVLGATCDIDSAPCERNAFCSFDEVCVRTPGLGEDCPDFECVAGATCNNDNVCVTLPGIGDACDFECVAGGYCSDAQVCIAIPGLGGDCSETFECTEDSTCDFDTFVCIEIVPPGDAAGEACRYNAGYPFTCARDATEPLVCLPNDTCALVIPVEVGGACDDDNRCIGSLSGSTVCDAGTCVAVEPEARIAIGDNCDVGTCVDGSYCGSDMNGDNICIAYAQLGDACNEDDICEDGTCVDGVCLSRADLYEQCAAG
jgi:hypothetical protein